MIVSYLDTIILSSVRIPLAYFQSITSLYFNAKYLVSNLNLNFKGNISRFLDSYQIILSRLPCADSCIPSYAAGKECLALGL